MDVITIKFNACREIYPIRILRPIPGEKIDNVEQLQKVLDELSSIQCRLKKLIGDKPKRSNIKCVKGHSAYFPCEYCIGKGTLILTSGVEKLIQNERANYEKQIVELKKQIEILKNTEQSENRDKHIEVLSSLLSGLQKSNIRKTTQIVWPASSRNAELRTIESIDSISSRIENGENLSVDESKGITGRSFLLTIPNFNFILDIPAEYMHTSCLGVIKRLTELTFQVGQNRPRLTKRKLTPVAYFNDRMKDIKVVFEFARRARELDFAVYKAQEFRNLCLYFAPLVIDCLPIDAKERILWLQLSFMLRACTAPNEEFACIEHTQIQFCMDNFYILFEKLFGAVNCSYSIHVVCSHLFAIRGDNPLTENAAFAYESFYGEMRNCFVPGTVSTTKQIMRNVFLKRKLSNHLCENPIKITAHDTALESNSMVYTFKNNAYQFYKVFDIDNDRQNLKCHIQGKYKCTFKETRNLNWDKVGVFEKGGLLKKKMNIKMSDVAGKVIQVQNYLLTCPNNVLREK